MAICEYPDGHIETYTEFLEATAFPAAATAAGQLTAFAAAAQVLQDNGDYQAVEVMRALAAKLADENSGRLFSLLYCLLRAWQSNPHSDHWNAIIVLMQLITNYRQKGAETK